MLYAGIEAGDVGLSRDVLVGEIADAIGSLQRELLRAAGRAAYERGTAGRQAGSHAPAWHPLGLMSQTQDYWGVHIAVPREDVEGVRKGAALTIPAERRSLTTELLPDAIAGETVLILEVRGGSEAEATDRATKAYLRAREAGGLSTAAPVDVIGLRSPIFRDEVIALREEADQLFSDGRHELAVVRAQTACELWAKRSLEGAFAAHMPRERAEAAVRLCRASLNDERTQTLIYAITVHRVTGAPWWALYQSHLRRRHGIVHAGLIITEDDAAASLDVVQDCIRWLRDLWSGELDR